MFAKERGARVHSRRDHSRFHAPVTANRSGPMMSAQRGDPVGQRLERELIGHVELEALARDLHEPHRTLQHRGLMLARQALEGLGGVERVDELWRAVGNHGGVAVAQGAHHQGEIEAGQRGAASGTPAEWTG